MGAAKGRFASVLHVRTYKHTHALLYVWPSPRPPSDDDHREENSCRNEVKRRGELIHPNTKSIVVYSVMTVVERIYIGGLDPSRLTAQQVASRLEASVSGVEIQSTDLVGGDKQFFYINVVSNDTDSTALSKIAKQYNNVTWKRCRLVVQAARPHFLERLAQERMQRQEDGQDLQAQEPREGRPIPRHLRIRQKFGAEAHQVDTKPCRTEEWSDFCAVVNKLRTKREQHNETLRLKKRDHTNEELLEKKRSFRNRAVHLRWTDESLREVSGGPVLVNVASDASVNNEQQDALSTSEHSETDDTESSVSIERPMQNSKHSEYVWSDESVSSVDDALDDNGGNMSVDDNDESVSSESESENDEKVSMHKVDDDHVKAKGSTDHKLSSSTSDLDEGRDGTTFPSRSSPLSSRVDTEEFSAAIDFSDSPSSSDDADDNTSVGESNEPLRFSADSQNLDNDVQSNLNVLSSLFPDMADMKPVAVNRDDNEDHGVARSGNVQSGWENGPSSGNASSFGLGLKMQRFDPTKESAKKYIITETQKGSTDSNVANEAPPDRLSDSERKRNDDEVSGTETSSDDSRSEANNDTKTNVYEQSRLEDIFRRGKIIGQW